jgi:hypothetical protein
MSLLISNCYFIFCTFSDLILLSTFASSMENLTPGRKLILDLLAKSVAKIEAAEVENEEKVELVKLDGSKGKMK